MSDIAKELDALASSLMNTGSPLIADIVRGGAREIRRLTNDLSSCRDCLLASGTESERRLSARVATLQEQGAELRREIDRLRRQNDLLCETTEALRSAYVAPRTVPYEDLD